MSIYHKRPFYRKYELFLKSNKKEVFRHYLLLNNYHKLYRESINRDTVEIKLLTLKAWLKQGIFQMYDIDKLKKRYIAF